MDYIYGELNIPSKNKKYIGGTTETFETNVCEVSDKLRAVSSKFLINNLLNKLYIDIIRCSENTLCSNNLIVGSRTIREIEV